MRGSFRAVEEMSQVHTLLIYLDQDEIVLVTLQPEFSSRDMNGVQRRLAYVDRRLQSFPHLRACDVPPEAVTLEVQPARTDCRYVCVDDEALRMLRRNELTRAAEVALDGASAGDAEREMNAAIAAIPGYVSAERERLLQADAEPAVTEAMACWASPGSLALLEESHADIAARIRAAARVIERHSPAEDGPDASGAAQRPPPDGQAMPSGIWRRSYDR
jgi:hypothetical protein